MDFYEAVNSRRSVRSFLADKPAEEAVARAFAAARMAPSQMNSQPWRFIVLDGEARDRLCRIVSASTRLLDDMFPLAGAEVLERAARFLSDLGGAPLVAVVTYPYTETPYDHKVNLLATGGSIVLLQAALAAEGLGSVCITCAEWVEDSIRRELGFEDERLAAVVPIGYPGGDQGERPPREDKVVRLSAWPS
ncbi:MAG: nitroreductase family protein [Thermoleophilia bacterium]